MDIIELFLDKARYWPKIAIFILFVHNNQLAKNGTKYFLEPRQMAKQQCVEKKFNPQSSEHQRYG